MAPALSVAERQTLRAHGFAVLPPRVRAEEMAGLAADYDAAVQAADPADVSVGRTTTRVTDFVNRGPAFDWLYVCPPLLDACALVIGPSFKLSSMHARTLHPRTGPQALHVDVARGAPGWPLLGFILMVDEFRPDNGATRFVPGSHRHPLENPAGGTSGHAGEVLACGPAGSIVVFDGSVWHGHSANRSPAPRRSVQGAFIPRHAAAAVDFAARMRFETLARLSTAARYVLALEAGADGPVPPKPY